jgi:hypothetical protein
MLVNILIDEKMRGISLRSLVVSVGLTSILGVGCDSQDSGQKPQTPSSSDASTMTLNDEDFSNALREFSSWQPILQGDQAFASKGHGGILVKGYLNSVAKTHLDMNATTYPLPVGSVFAKAVVAEVGTPAQQASRVYFMRKEAAGFDSENGDWSYGLAKRQGDRLVLDTTLDRRASMCVSCHVNFSQFDNVKTAEFYRQQRVN